MSGDRFQPTADSGGGGGGSGITQLTQDVLAGPGSGSVAATVVGLRTRGISAVAPTNGQVLQYDSGTGLWTPTTPTSGGGASLYPALDANDLGYWDYQEASGNFANQGTAAGVDLVPGGSGLLYKQGAPLGRGAFSAQTTTLESAVTGAIAPTSGTILLLVKPQYFPSSTSYLGWFGIVDPVTPKYPFAIVLQSVAPALGNRATAVWSIGLTTTVGGYHQLDMADGSGFSDYTGVTWNQWNLMAATYDGATLKAYMNGGVVKSQAITGAIDYTGASSEILSGGASAQAGWRALGWLGYMRIRDVVMSEDDILLAYRSAMAWA